MTSSSQQQFTEQHLSELVSHNTEDLPRKRLVQLRQLYLEKYYYKSPIQPRIPEIILDIWPKIDPLSSSKKVQITITDCYPDTHFPMLYRPNPGSPYHSIDMPNFPYPMDIYIQQYMALKPHKRFWFQREYKDIPDFLEMEYDKRYIFRQSCRSQTIVYKKRLEDETDKLIFENQVRFYTFKQKMILLSKTIEHYQLLQSVLVHETDFQILQCILFDLRSKLHLI